MKKPWLAYYEDGTPAEVDIPDWPITDDLQANAESFPRHPALIYGNVVEPLGDLLLDRSISFGRLHGLVRRFAAGLQQLGVRQGDRVLLHLPNCPQFVIAYYATLMVGGIVVPSNPEYVARELVHQVNDAGAETAITLSLTYPTMKTIRAQTPLRRVIVTNVKEYFPWPLKGLFTLFKERQEGHYQDISGDRRTCWFQQVLAGAPERPEPVDLEMEETAVLMYTGGTTGTIKGAQLTHRNIQANAVQIRHWFPTMYEGEESILAALPFYHSYGMSTCLNLGIRTRTTLILIVDPRKTIHVLRSIDRHAPTAYPGVPGFYTAIINHPARERHRLDSVRFCISGAAPLPTAVQAAFEALTDGRLVEGYGLTEASPVTHANPVFGENRVGTIGIPFPSTEAKIVDGGTGTCELPIGEAGELIVCGPQVMKGYWHRPEETAMALRDGWLYTGDIARMDADGYFQVIDRKRDVIVSAGGFTIYPSEVEAVLRAHPQIEACGVIGVPTGPERGEQVKAFCIRTNGAHVAEEELIAFCRENLTPYKVPKEIQFRQTLPRTPFGKVARRLLKTEEEGRLD